MALPLPRVPGPADVFGWTVRTATQAASVPGRVLDLLGAAEAVVARANALVDRTDKVITDATGAVAEAQRVTKAAGEQVDAIRPLIRFAEEFSSHELDAAIRLVDELPRLTQHVTDDVLPILATLDRVGPDIHDLLDVANDVRQAILGIPGFNFLRRRGEDKDDDRDEKDDRKDKDDD